MATRRRTVRGWAWTTPQGRIKRWGNPPNVLWIFTKPQRNLDWVGGQFVEVTITLPARRPARGRKAR